MGSNFQVTQKMEEEWAREDAAKAAAKKAIMNAELSALAKKIVMVMVDRINADVVRPGPKPEERECYEMAQELHDHKSELEKLVEAVLEQHNILERP